MRFPDYTKTKIIYHVANINDLNNILKEGIKFNDKISYKTKYLDFHKFIDIYKPSIIPKWVIREKAIFGSMNFKDTQKWHSHSVILGLKIDENKCWIANENLVNEIYEPFILKEIDRFKYMSNYIDNQGMDNVKKYWDSSLSFVDNLEKRVDKDQRFDCEVLIFHDIKPEEIIPIAIISDHKYIEYNELHDIYFKEGEK